MDEIYSTNSTIVRHSRLFAREGECALYIVQIMSAAAIEIYRPAIFELIASDKLISAIKPAFKHIVTVS